MAVTANPHATEAALDILRLGGNAVDAAIAAQWVLNLVEPQSSGIGGGGFLLHWDAVRRQLSAWDGRETAPKEVAVGFANRADGATERFEEIAASGKSVGVPGLVSMLEAVHKQHGKLVWQRLFSRAIQLGQSGFPVSPRLNSLLTQDPFLRNDPAAKVLYYDPDGMPRPAGWSLINRELANTFLRLSAEGSRALHAGTLAESLVTTVRGRGGAITTDDLAAYRPRERDPLCKPYRRYTVCGMPPPSSGGVAVAQILALLERSGGPMVEPQAPDSIHRFAEAGRLAFADRARYLADPDFVRVPLGDLLAPGYLERRARLIHPGRSMGPATSGTLLGKVSWISRESGELPATTHLSVVDAEGNAVALTSSIEAGFGSRIQVGGFLLNNQLTDFSFASEQDGVVVANRPESGKRPLSSMAPTMVFDAHGRLWAVLGSPGGPNIINYVARTIVSLVDASMSPADAVALPHAGSRNGPLELERGTLLTGLKSSMEGLGHKVSISDMTSGLHLIVRTPSGWMGAADPRREGLAGGE